MEARRLEPQSRQGRSLPILMEKQKCPCSLASVWRYRAEFPENEHWERSLWLSIASRFQLSGDRLPRIRNGYRVAVLERQPRSSEENDGSSHLQIDRRVPRQERLLGCPILS